MHCFFPVQYYWATHLVWACLKMSSTSILLISVFKGSWVSWSACTDAVSNYRSAMNCFDALKRLKFPFHMDWNGTTCWWMTSSTPGTARMVLLICWSLFYAERRCLARCVHVLLFVTLFGRSVCGVRYQLGFQYFQGLLKVIWVRRYACIGLQVAELTGQSLVRSETLAGSFSGMMTEREWGNYDGPSSSRGIFYYNIFG